jgi:hypothetical protein
VVLDAFQGGYLLLDLAAQLSMAVADFGQTALDGFHVDLDNLGLRLRPRLLSGVDVGSHECADGGGEVAVDHRQQLLHQRDGGAKGVEGAVKAGLVRVGNGRRVGRLARR